MTYQYQESTNLQDDSHSSLHRLSNEISCWPFLCIPRRCGFHVEEVELHMWLEYPILPHWSPHVARVYTNHSGIYEWKNSLVMLNFSFYSLHQWWSRGKPPVKTSVPGNVVFWILTVIGQTAKQITFVAHQGKTVAKARTGRGAILRVFSFQLLPFPSACLKLQQYFNQHLISDWHECKQVFVLII